MSADVISNTSLELVGSWQLPYHETIQSFFRDINGEWYVSQAIKGTLDNTETVVISRLAVDGAFVAKMELIDAGHGTSIYGRRVGESLFIGLNQNHVNGEGKVVRSDCIEVKWSPNVSFKGAHPSVKVIGSKMTAGYVIPYYDKATDSILLRKSEGGSEYYFKRPFVAFLENRVTTPQQLGPFSHDDHGVMQGMASDGNTLYKLTGNSSGSDPRMLRVFDFASGKQVATKPLLTLGGAGKFREPEGLFIERSGGATRLYIGCTTKVGTKYVHLVYLLTDAQRTPIHSTVKSSWRKWITEHEGETNWLYFDTKNLATTGIGNMIDAGSGLTALGLSLPWKRLDGKLATQAEIKAEYNRLKRLGIQAQGGFAYRKHASLFLDQSTIEWLVTNKRDEFWSILVKTFPLLPQWPADAQLALLGMAWWMGPYFTNTWPNFTAAGLSGDFVTMMENCVTRAKAPRDYDHQEMFANAARVQAAGLDTSTLYLDNPVQVTVGDKIFPAQYTLSAAVLGQAKPSVFSPTAWYVQRMLVKFDAYPAKAVDGLWGPMSKVALATLLESRGWTLNTLSRKSGLMMKII